MGGAEVLSRAVLTSVLVADQFHVPALRSHYIGGRVVVVGKKQILASARNRIGMIQ